MKRAQDFLRDNNSLSLDINHFDYGKFPLGFHYHDIIPHNRLYIINPESASRGSYIRLRSPREEKLYLHPGSMYFIPASFDLEYNFHPRLLIAGIHFDLELFSGLDLFQGDQKLRSIPDPNDWSRQIWSCLGEPASLSRAARLRGMILSAAGLFADKSVEELKRIKDLQERFGPLFDWLRKNIRAGIQIQDLAELMETSSGALSKAFSRHMGYSLKELISRELIREAVNHVVFSDRKIKEIARELQFNDEYYFSRFFSKHTGLSPGEYRKRYATTIP